MTEPPLLTKKIYNHDTDCVGVVYYANYLKYFEEGRCEFFAGLGCSLADLAHQGFLFVVAKTEVEYKAPARYQEIVTIGTRLAEVRNASLRFVQEVRRGETLLVRAKTFTVCISPRFKPVPLPPDIRKILVSAATPDECTTVGRKACNERRGTNNVQ